MHINDLLWLAGVLEGDGCFSVRKRKKHGSSPTISLSSIDKDTVEKICLLGCFLYGSENPRGLNEKPIHKAFILGKAAAVISEALCPYMGLRRQKKINENLSSYYGRDVIEPRTIKKDIPDLEGLKKDRLHMSYRQLAKKYRFSHETIRRFLLGLSFQEPNSNNAQVSVEEYHQVDEFNWVAGLLEAEGSFICGPPSRPNSPIISIQMTDRDVIEKYAKYMKRTFYSWQRAPHETSRFKKVYVCVIKGEKAIQWMVKLFPLMSHRRQTQIKKAISSYNKNAKAKSLEASRKLSDQDIRVIREKIKKLSIRSIAKEYGVHHETIRYRLGRSGKNNKNQAPI